MEIDGTRARGKTEQNRDELLRVRTCMAKDCWFKETNTWQEMQREKQEQCERGHDSDGVSDDSTRRNPASQLSRTTQDTDTWDRPVPIDEGEGEKFETGYILAAGSNLEQRTNTCADEHARSPRDFEWIAIEPSRNPRLVSASVHKLKHGEESVPMKLRDGRNIWITFQVCEVKGLGKFCTKGTTDARHSRHVVVSCGTKKPERIGRQSSTPLRIGMLDTVLAPVQDCCSSGSASEAGHFAASPQ